MKTRIQKNTRDEIIVNDCPIGYVLLNDEGKVHWAELYDDFVHTKFEAVILREFVEKINEYEWIDND